MYGGGFVSVLSIAGFDPSAGAGVLADIKVFEQHKVYGCGINTAITYQNDVHFEAVDWLSIGQISRQFHVLTQRFDFSYIKIGLVENLDRLHEIVKLLKGYKKEIRIIWDPILKASAGFIFHSDINREKLKEVLSEIYLITPNAEEVLRLTGVHDTEKAAQQMAELTHVLLKGGHGTGAESVDMLFYNGEVYSYPIIRLGFEYTKHGSGCVLSAAITAALVSGMDLPEACEQAKAYTYEFLRSNTAPTGYHHHIDVEKKVEE